MRQRVERHNFARFPLQIDEQIDPQPDQTIPAGIRTTITHESRGFALPLNFELLHLLVLIQIKCDLRVAVKLDAVDLRIFKDAVPPRTLHQFAISVKGVDPECDRFNPLNRITFDIFSSVFIAFGIPDTPVKRNDVRLESALLCSFVRFPVGDGKDLMLPPAFWALTVDEKYAPSEPHGEEEGGFF